MPPHLQRVDVGGTSVNVPASSRGTLVVRWNLRAGAKGPALDVLAGAMGVILAGTQVQVGSEERLLDSSSFLPLQQTKTKVILSP